MSFRTRARAGLSVVLALAFVLTALGPTTQSARAAGVAHLSRYRVPAGGSFSIAGSGFSANDEVVTSVDFRVGNSVQRIAAIAQADTNGNFAATIAVPSGTLQGAYTVAARDFHGNMAEQHVAVLPVVYLQVGANHPQAVVGNHEFYAFGAGYGAGEAVTIAASFPTYNGNTVQVTRNGTTDKNGKFYEVLVPLPRDAKAGKATVIATGQSSGKKATDTLYVTYHPSIVLASTAVRPGAPVVVNGHDFVPFANVHVSITFPREGASTVTFTRDAKVDANGNFNASIGMPSNAKPGTYTISAVGTASGFKAYAQVTISIHPVATVAPGSAFPGQVITVTGNGFGNHVSIAVSGTFATSSGNKTVTANTTSTGNDTYSAQLIIPTNATPGKMTLTATGPHGAAKTTIEVQQKPAPKPTSTPVPTATAVPATPVPTSIQLPPPPAHGKFHKSHGLQFTFISIWYHPIRVGTTEHLVIRAKPKKQIGIWVKVYFPNHTTYAVYENTDASGQWSKAFTIPRNALSSGGGQTIVTFQLWSGKNTVKEFRQFYIVH
ncbi:MAG: hypothetical protein PVSMB7_09130 [Chloroflexota bacterium]